MIKSNETNQEVDASIPAASRRKFLVKASAGAVIASIPAKSVWATGLTNSIVASGHGSDFSGGVAFQLQGPDYWRDSSQDLSHTYSSVFKSNPILFHELANFLGSENLSRVSIGAILGELEEMKSVMALAGAVWGNFEGVWQFQATVNGETVYFTRWKVRNWFASTSLPSEGRQINRLVVSAYLNAVFSESVFGVVYPVLRSNKYPRAPFATAAEFATTLHASIGHPNSETMLSDLHFNTNSLATYR